MVIYSTLDFEIAVIEQCALNTIHRQRFWAFPANDLCVRPAMSLIDGILGLAVPVVIRRPMVN